MIKNSKGFVLVETLVVTAFVAAVFSVIYVNFYPLAGEYERRTFYDDIDSKYGAYWVKFFVQRNSYPSFTAQNIINNNSYLEFSCNKITDSFDKTMCKNMMDRLGLEKAIITFYQLSDDDDNADGLTFTGIKSKADSVADSVFQNDPAFVAYIHYLPNYTVKSLNGARYRVICKFKRSGDSLETKELNDTYATMEVIK